MTQFSDIFVYPIAVFVSFFVLLYWNFHNNDKIESIIRHYGGPKFVTYTVLNIFRFVPSIGLFVNIRQHQSVNVQYYVIISNFLSTSFDCNINCNGFISIDFSENKFRYARQCNVYNEYISLRRKMYQLKGFDTV